MITSNNTVADILKQPLEKSTLELKKYFDCNGAVDLLYALGKAVGNWPSYNTAPKIVDFVKTYFSSAPRSIRTVGIYYQHITPGGVQRVITSQFPIFRDMGLKLVFFTKSPIQPNEYPLPDYVERVQIPLPDASSANFRKDLEDCINTIKSKNIDLFYNHNCLNVATPFWLSLIAKVALEVPYFAHYHNVFSRCLPSTLYYEFAIVGELLKMSDLLISLSEVDRLYFAASGINTVYMSNTYFLPDTVVAAKEEALGQTLLFLARVDHSQRRPLSAIRIMENVVKQLPNAKLLFVGGGDEGSEETLKEAIKNSPAAKNIEFCGSQLDVASYYQRSDIFLCTSNREGFPVALLEAQAFGLPVVAYDMPYLEIVRHANNGIVTVPQDDQVAAADAIVELLSNKELYRRKARNGFETARHFSQIDLKEQWRRIFEDWHAVAHSDMQDNKDLSIMLSTIRQHIYWANQKGKEKSQKEREKLQHLTAEYNRIKSSFSYRLGSALTCLPKLIFSKRRKAPVDKNQVRIEDKQKKAYLSCALPNTGCQQIEFWAQDIFTAEKIEGLRRLSVALLPLWQGVPDAIQPFVCRKKCAEVKLSVIVPVHNVEMFLTKCLQSIANQTLNDIEIICVDDGSTDRSLEILNFFAAFDERFTVITQANLNAGAARNRALDVARGKYLYFMDADDFCLPEMLETAVNTAEEENCEIVVWSHWAVDSDTKEILWGKLFNDEIIDIASTKNLFVYLTPNVWNKIFLTRMVVENNLRFQEITNNNDASFAHTAVALAKKIRTLATPMYFYRKSGSGLQATLYSDPYCALKARIHFKEELIRLGLWTPQFYMHFVDAFYHLLANQLARVPLSLEELIKVRDMLREHFDFSMIKYEDVDDKEAYSLIQALVFSNDDCYLTQLINNLKNYKRESAKYKRQMNDYKQKYSNAIEDSRALRKSVSYCAGRILTWLPRKIRGGIRCLSDNGLNYTIKRLGQKISGVRK